jgi:group I intron endonuclease
MGYIYQIKNNITGKCYIGQTTKLPESRWKRHISTLTHKGGCPALKDAITQYGIESFTFRVLIICFDEAVHLIEKIYIDKYQSQVPYGYNILPGGQLGGGFLGKAHSAEAKERIKESGKKFREANPHHFETYREKLKESMKKVDISACVKQSEKFQKAIKERRLGTSGPTSEEKKQKIREGVLRYYENGGPTTRVNIEKHREIMTKARGKPVAQYTAENVFVKEYPSIADAGRHSGVSAKCIQQAVKGINRKAGGFLWKYIQPKGA